MKKDRVVLPGEGREFDWAQDRVLVKTMAEMTEGRVTVVEDTLKPGFDLARHHHKRMVEIFYILEGSVRFAFDDETVVATPGTTINIRPEVRHHVTSEAGGRLLTIFTPGGFDSYLSEIAAMAADMQADAAVMTRLAERYDIWAN